MEWPEIESRMKRVPPVSEQELDRVMSRIRETPAEGAAHDAFDVAPDRHRWTWFFRPVPIGVRPIYGIAALLLLAVGIYAARRDGLPGGRQDAPQTAAAPNVALRPVQFVVVAADAREVTIAGDFNDWSLTATPLHRQGGAGLWSVEIPLAPGRHVYSFIIDGKRWVPDAVAPRSADSEFGGSNSVILVEKAS
jgi:hypothetical protein